ncbi:phytanoyl-CoA dioxygenase family protein [Coralliovum pocilloporae]|uniref:phytanoyl-CoA dioxygenase family protein n=1 Tax=Coralliovum pocilloporae TaxID=3066369 RepID=UPI0033079FE4
MSCDYVTKTDIDAYERDGVVRIRGLFKDWVDVIAAGIERNLAEPGPYAAENLTETDTGRFFDDYCNWQRIPEFRNVIENSPAAEVAAAITGSKTAQIFHDHVLVKEPGTSKATPWHQDHPYYFVDGQQLVSFWIPVDPVKDATLRFIAESHKWEKMVLPTRWLKEDNFYDSGDYRPVPNPDSPDEDHRVLEWEMEPGDAVLFHYRTAHGARANEGGSRRRAFSMRWVGDDARYITRPGRTSPPFPDHGMSDGERLREDWFPVLWPKSA